MHAVNSRFAFAEPRARVAPGAIQWETVAFLMQDPSNGGGSNTQQAALASSMFSQLEGPDSSLVLFSIGLPLHFLGRP
jgi:hypothetical protein